MKLLSFIFLLIPGIPFPRHHYMNEATSNHDFREENRLVITDNRDTLPDCFDAKYIQKLANDITSMESGPEGYAYQFEETLYQASCITKADMDNSDVAPLLQKLRAMWNKHKNEFLAQSMLFSKGHVIKYAIRLGFKEFIEEVVIWNLSLDINDGTGETILQYLEREIRNPSNAGLQDDLNYIKRQLLKAMKVQGLKIE